MLHDEREISLLAIFLSQWFILHEFTIDIENRNGRLEKILESLSTFLDVITQ